MVRTGVIILIVSLLISRVESIGGHGRRIIYIGGLLDNIGMVPVIQHALRDVNNNPMILPNHQLQLAFGIVPNGCDVTTAFEKSIDIVDILPRKYFILNGLCTHVLERINSERSGRFPSTQQLSITNSDPIFDLHFHKSIFRMVPSELRFNQPRTKLVEGITRHEGGRIGLLYHNSPRYSTSHDDQVNQLLQIGSTRFNSESFDDATTMIDIQAILRRFKDSGIKILLGNFNSTFAIQILCSAYKEGLYGEDYSWILAGDYESNWWRDSTHVSRCFPHEMDKALDGMLRIDLMPYIDKKSSEHRTFYQQLHGSKFDGYAYDGVWAIAHAFHNVTKFYAKRFKGSSLILSDEILTNSTINQSPLWDDSLRHSLMDVSFTGVTGPVRFSPNQRRLGYSLIVKQYQALTSGYDEVNVAEFESISQKLLFDRFQYRLVQRNIPTPPPKVDVNGYTQNDDEVEAGNIGPGLYPYTTANAKGATIHYSTWSHLIVFAIFMFA